ncbi:dolichyl-diphosphooligosaccharide--protein glycosyltransferase subunit TUSC3-like [Clavelina lepadiformis]|uniref:dolichyl-diphosphooligosaccharide--protein glycosyltransferase subunit TUSC3-like n=1 Tax=Clavelina lepadiformis TaxID=159417 RepID=UPI0040435557
MNAIKGSLILFIIGLFCHTASPKTKQEVLQEKVHQLMEWSNRRTVIQMGGSKFANYVKSKPRNYSVIVMFTALNPKRGCSVCQEASDEFTILANSYRFSPAYSNSLFFGVVDFDDGQDIFRTLGLNSAPAFIHFPAKGKRKAVDTYDIQRYGFHADNIAKWMAERTEIVVRIFRPPNYMGTVVLVLLFSLAGGLLYVRRNSLDFFYNKTFWGVLSIFIVLGMTSGQMWNHIRGPPYYHRNPQNGAIHYIHGSSQGQLVAETHLVMLINAAIVVGFALLSEVHNPEMEVSKRRVFAIGGLVMVVFFFSLLISVFRRKYQSYPYSLLIR